jgi:thiol:disulfide interchange protein
LPSLEKIFLNILDRNFIKQIVFNHFTQIGIVFDIRIKCNMFIMKVYAKFLLLGLLVFASCKSKDIILPADDLPAGMVHFENENTLGAVLDKAKADNKLVFVDFYTDWCIGCKLMDQDVFTDKPMADFLNENFVSFKINAEEGVGPDLAELYQIQAFPTLLFLDERGRVLVRKDGTAYFTELRKMGNEALAFKDMGVR